MPLEKNQEIELAITGMSAQGRGVGRWGPQDGGLAGRVRSLYGCGRSDPLPYRQGAEKPMAFGRLSELLEPSADRLPGGRGGGLRGLRPLRRLRLPAPVL